MVDTNLSFTIKMPYKVRCQLPDCAKAVNYVHKVNQDGYSINFCSNDHARVGIERWADKKARGITPGSRRPVENEIEMTGDNIEEVDGE